MNEVFTNEEFVKYCKDIIDSVVVKTEEAYNLSVIALDAMLKVAANEFQASCIRAAYCKIWEPETKTICCLFD